MGVADGGVSLERTQRPRGTDQREFGPQSVGTEEHAQARRAFEGRVADTHRRQARPRGYDPAPQPGFLLHPGGAERARITVEIVSPAHDFHPRREILRCPDFDRQPEAIEQLRAQLAFLRVAAAHEHEARRMTYAQAFALDDVFAGRGHVDQQVDEVILQQIDLVDVEKAAMGASEEAWLERLFAAVQRAREIERADHAILRRAEGQLDHGHRHPPARKRPAGVARAALVAVRVTLSRVAAVAAALDHLHRRQECRERADRRRLAGAAIAENKHATDGRIDRCDQQRSFHLVLADQRCKRKSRRHGVGISGNGRRTSRRAEKRGDCNCNASRSHGRRSDEPHRRLRSMRNGSSARTKRERKRASDRLSCIARTRSPQRLVDTIERA